MGFRESLVSTEPESPWANGYSIDVLREVSAGLVAQVSGYAAIPVDVAGVAAEWVIADGVPADAPVVLYFHGGAHLCGTPQQYRNATVWFSRKAGVRLLVPDYRLAPEYPFPAGFDDAVTCYRWCRQRGHTPVAVSGDSAGSALAVATVLDALHSHQPLPGSLVVNSPFVDLSLASPSLNDPLLNQSEPNKRTIQWLAAEFLVAGVNPQDPRHSPVYADLSGLPPLLVQVGGRDNLSDDGRRLAQRARESDVAVELSEYPESGHIWWVASPADANADSARGVLEAARFVRRHAGLDD